MDHVFITTIQKSNIVIPASINSKHIQKAMQKIIKVGFPKKNKSRKHCLKVDGRHFPPKYTVALANSFITGYLLGSEEFEGGDQTNDFLRDRGFTIVDCTCGGGMMTDAPAAAQTVRAALVFPTLKRKGPKIPAVSEFGGERVDFVLFPECYMRDKTHYKALRKLASKLGAPLLVGACADIARDLALVLPMTSAQLTDESIETGYAQTLLQFNPDGSEPITTYLKHSTAGLVAFESVNWSPHNNLPVFELGNTQVGTTICQDHYLGLLQRHLAKNEARIWLNPSYSNVVDAKWASVLRLRAVENRVFALCTLHDNPKHRVRTHPFAFSPDGSELCARKAGSADMRPISACRKPNTIYIVDLDMTPVRRQLDWSRLSANKQLNPNKNLQKPVRVSLRDGRPAVYVREKRWSDISTGNNCVDTQYGKVYVGIISGRKILDATVCFRVIDNAYRMDCHPIIWNHWNKHLPTAESDRMAHLLKGRVIECCAPIIISDKDGIHELVELSNANKIPVRRPVKLSEAVVDVGRAWGMDSAFKMVTEYVFPENRTDVLDKYRNLC